MANAAYTAQFISWSSQDLLALDVPLNRAFRRLLQLPPTTRASDGTRTWLDLATVSAFVLDFVTNPQRFQNTKKTSLPLWQNAFVEHFSTNMQSLQWHQSDPLSAEEALALQNQSQFGEMILAFGNGTHLRLHLWKITLSLPSWVARLCKHRRWKRRC